MVLVRTLVPRVVQLDRSVNQMKKHILTILALVMVGCGKKRMTESDSQVSASFRDSTHIIIAKHLGIPVERVRDDVTFASIGADDLDLVEITMAVEDAHGLSIIDDALVAAAGVTRAERLVHELTVGAFLGVASSAEKVPPPDAAGAAAGDKPPVGVYADLAKMDLGEEKVIVFIPSLASILVHHEGKKGSALTEADVLAIRDQSATVALPKGIAQEMTKSRGYADLDPQKCWQNWQELREQIQKEKTEQD